MYSNLCLSFCETVPLTQKHLSTVPVNLSELLGNILEHGLHPLASTAAGLVDAGHQVVALLTVTVLTRSSKINLKDSYFYEVNADV